MAVTRHAVYGGIGMPYGSFAGKASQVVDAALDLFRDVAFVYSEDDDTLLLLAGAIVAGMGVMNKRTD